MTTRGTLALLVSFGLVTVVVLALDAHASAEEHLALGLVAWVFLAATLALQPRPIQVQVLVLVGVATVLEVIGSLIWRAYTYRLQDLPLFVPAGHGLFYLTALRVAALPALARHARAIVVAVTLGATAWLLGGLVRAPLPDLLGFVVWAIFLRFILRGRHPLLYSVSFVMTAALEFYGTGLGIWTWSPVLPVLWLPAGNPPACIGAGYAAMDALTRRIVGRMGRTASFGRPDGIRPVTFSLKGRRARETLNWRI